MQNTRKFIADEFKFTSDEDKFIGDEFKRVHNNTSCTTIAAQLVLYL